MLDTPQLAETEEEKRQLMISHFATTFSLPREDELITDLEVCLYRVLPVTGRLFISSKHLCFRSSNLATKTIGKTKMILPFQEIVSCAVHPAFRYGWHGLVTMVRGHEEIFFEFGSKDKRDLCLRQIEARIEARHDVKMKHTASSDASQQERQDALVLTDLTAKANELSLGESISSLASSSSGSDFQQDGSLLSFKPKQSMHFTILTIGSRGDVQPFLALSKGLIADGHRVRMATHAEFGPWIQQHGVDFVEIGGDPAELMKICVENGTFTVSFLREGVTKFRGWLDELLVSCWHACQGTDVIIESPNAIAGIHISEALQVPYFRAFTMPWSRTRAYPQAFAVPNKKAGGNYNYMTYVIFDQVLWTASAGQINRWRTSCLGLLPTNLDKLEQHKTPFLYNFSPSLVPKPLDWYDWIHVTGFWFLDNPENSSSKAWSPPEDLLAFIARARKLGKKLVYIGWGSITVPNAAATTRCVTEAVRMSNVCAILSKGWSDRLTKKAGATESAAANASPYLSEDVFQVNSVPHDWLFPQMDAACHHGGAGTLGASLRAGIPTIVKPFFGDQFFWGQQVESLGVGSCVRDLTIDALSNALVQATQSTRQIERARELGRQIRAENGVAEAIRAIYADLDYARSLIKKDTRSMRTTAEGGPMQGRHSRSISTTAASSPSGLSSPSGARSFSPGGTATSQRGRTPLGAAQGPNRSRANSGYTTSDEWSVVSGSEEDEERRAALAE
jgi:UDP:flavonoid glycosyltransferase YjiC (YdhE family)